MGTLEELPVNTKVVEETEQIRHSQLMETFCLQGKEIQLKLNQEYKREYVGSVHQDVQIFLQARLNPGLQKLLPALSPLLSAQLA